MRSTVSDLTDKVFGRWTVLGRCTKKHLGTTAYWRVRCACGNLRSVQHYSLTDGKSKSCGCICAEAGDLTGKVFGRWTVLRRAGKGGKWQARCICGTVRCVCGGNLTQGLSKSCGCLNLELIAARAYKHGYKVGIRQGKKVIPEYVVWARMNQRCANPNVKEYPRYGGRGVLVCNRWRTSFENFLADMGPRPKHGGLWSIDRIDNNKGYFPDNCRWTDSKTQARNTRRNTNFSLDGKTQCVAAWNEELGASHSTISRRLRRGWTQREALTTPLRSNEVVFSFKDKTQCMAAWARELGINVGTVKTRLRMGWNMHDALTTPVRKHKEYVRYK